MKKLLLILLLPILLLTGCSSDKSIINNAREIAFSNGQSLEDIVVKKLVVIDFLTKNATPLDIEKNSMKFKEDSFSYLLTDDTLYTSYGSKVSIKDLQSVFKYYDVKASNNLDVTWSILGDTENGKVIRAATENGHVDAKIVINGDIIEASTDNIIPAGEIFNFDLDPITLHTALYVNTFLNNGEDAKATHKVIESSAIFQTLEKITSLFKGEEKEVAKVTTAPEKKEEVATPVPEVVTEKKVDFLEKIKNRELKYEIDSLDENESEVKVTFIVNGKYLFYTYYKTSIAFKNAEADLKNDEDSIFTSDNPYEKDSSYHYYLIEPTMGSAKWATLLGNNEIIRAGGEGYSEANENLDAFYVELQKLKNGNSTSSVKDSKEVKNVATSVTSKEEFLNKIKMNQFEYKYSTFDNKDDYTKITFKINDYDLEYTYYRDSNQYSTDAGLFLNNEALEFLGEGPYSQDESYYLYYLQGNKNSKFSGQWCALIGNNEIIISHGKDSNIAEKNLSNFFTQLQKLK